MFLVIDIGTSSLRAVVVSEQGRILSLSRVPVRVDHPGPGLAEVDVEEVWQGAVRAASLEMARNPEMDIEAVGVTAMLGYVFLDRHEKPLAPAVIYMDNRAGAQSREILSRISLSRIYQITGRRISPELLAPKLMWLAAHKPDLGARVDRVIGLKDEVVRRLTGKVVTDYSHANYTLLFNIAQKKYDAEMLEVCGVRASLFPEPQPADDPAGRVTPDAAREIGLKSGTPVVVGASDGTSAMYGGGVLNRKRAVLVSGTTDVMMAAAPIIPRDPKGLLTVNNAMVPDFYLAGGAMGLSGGALNKIKSLLKSDPAGMESAIGGLPPGSNGLMFFPGLTGERAPYWREYSTGALIGLTPVHTEAHIIRALMEGTCFRIRKLLELMKENGLVPDGVNLTGGGGQSEVWNQIRADVLGLEIVGLSEIEASALGAAMFCRAGLDKAVSLTGLADEWIGREKIYRPEIQAGESYTRLGRIFDQYLEDSARVMAGLREFR